MKKKNDKNFLYYTPVPCRNLSYSVDDNGKVVLKISRDSLFDKMAQCVKNTPKATYITLDRYGSYLWQKMDGQTNVIELCNMIDQEFGPSVYPLEERLVLFLKSLRDNNLIWFRSYHKKCSE